MISPYSIVENRFFDGHLNEEYNEITYISVVLNLEEIRVELDMIRTG